MPRGRKKAAPTSPLTPGDAGRELEHVSGPGRTVDARRRDEPDLATCTLNLIRTLQDIPDEHRPNVLQAALIVVGLQVPSRSIVGEQERMLGVNGERARA